MKTPLRVLLVEDNPGDADLTKETLEEANPRLEVTVVVDGLAALAYLLSREPFVGARRPDLVLLDLNLPRVSGTEVLAEMKRVPALQSIPVVVLSSSSAPGDVRSTYTIGASCYVTKPVGLTAFQELVRDIHHFWLELAVLP